MPISPPTVPPRRVIVGVSAGIAAYKSAELVRRLGEAGHDVTVVPTAESLNFVGAATWAALSHNPVATDVWTDPNEVRHVLLGRHADLVIVAPATADLISRAAHGRADDLLTNVLLTARCPVLFAPAMHTEMWSHPATVDNVATLRRRGVLVTEPAIGRLTGADTGKGRLAEPEELVELAELVLAIGRPPPHDLAGTHVVITAGGTREPLDPVRFLGNRSSGKQGVALARVAAARGARVSLIAANLDQPNLAGVEVSRVGTAEQLREATEAAAKDCDVVVMAAAVADFRPAAVADHKIKKQDGDPAAVELVRTRDILAELVQARRDARLPAGTVLVGFAAETGDDTADELTLGQQKLARKGCDLLVVNSVAEGRAFGRDDNSAVLLAADGTSVSTGLVAKIVLANAVWDSVAGLRAR